MKVSLQYVNDAYGNTSAIQIPVGEWKRVLAKLKKYEQALHLKSDMQEALAEVKQLKTKKNKQSLSDFLATI